ncbi:MAG: hypothetical protein WC310_00370 [Patescibacteria group bacterium]|jgi:hypothetical protein
MSVLKTDEEVNAWLININGRTLLADERALREIAQNGGRLPLCSRAEAFLLSEQPTAVEAIFLQNEHNDLLHREPVLVGGATFQLPGNSRVPTRSYPGLNIHLLKRCLAAAITDRKLMVKIKTTPEQLLAIKKQAMPW